MNISIPEKIRLFTGSQLKIIALISMLIDHFALIILYWGYLYPNQPIIIGSDLHTLLKVYNVLRGIGRLAFPIFCFLLVEGFLHTSSRPKYALRLGVFALISEIPYDLGINNSWYYPEKCNVFITLLIGLLVIWAMEHFAGRFYLQAAAFAAGALLAYVIHSDYDYRGIILIALLYLFRYYRLMQALAGSVSLYWEWPAIFAFIPICMYNGKRGRSLPKYLFYAFYPAHLLLLCLIASLLR